MVRRLGRYGLAVGIFGAGVTGCAALSGATQSVSDTTGQVNSSTSTLDSAKGTVDSNKDKLKTESDKAKKKKDGTPAAGAAGPADPDGDGSRATAKDSKQNEPITDNVDPKKNDTIDWKAFELGGRPGLATAQLNWDDPTADLSIDVYDAFGTELAASPPRGPSTAKKVLVQIDQPGKYYVRITALKGGSDYTMALRWGGTPPVAAVVQPASLPPPSAPAPAGGAAGGAASGAAGGAGQIPNPAGGGAGGPPPAGGAPPPAAAAGGAPALPSADDPMHPRGKIVQSFRDDDGRLVLYIDKGSSANIRAGMTGFILDGKEEKKLDGGDFTITKVIDATHSVAKTSIAKVGKNNHCMINLVK